MPIKNFRFIWDNLVEIVNAKLISYQSWLLWGPILPRAAIKAGVPDMYATSFQRDIGVGFIVGERRCGKRPLASLGSRKNHSHSLDVC